MTVLRLWKTSPKLLEEKSVKQLIAIAGSGKLIDGNDTSTEFRALLAEVGSTQLIRYAHECLEQPFNDSGLVLQDVTNEIGRRLGLSVTNGFYRGRPNAIGNDGLWLLPNGHTIVVEVKTTDAYRIDLDTIATYRRTLIQNGAVLEERSSVLIIVGRTDTGDLEAQIRGSRHAWSMRLLSVDALVRLMQLKESLEDPDALRRIYEILIPREFTKLDEIVDVVFSTAEDAKQLDDEPESGQSTDRSASLVDASPKFTPVAFNELVAAKVSSRLGIPLLKRTRALFSSSDDKHRVLCAVSRSHLEGNRDVYWFAFHPHQKEVLEAVQSSYVAFGCGSPNLLVMVPMSTFAGWLPNMNMTVKPDRMYWHVHIYNEGQRLALAQKGGIPRVDLSQFTLRT
jgi:hypothetical protein